MDHDPPAPAVLVVDDTVENLRLLEAMLSHRGFRVRAARGGEAALQTVAVAPPDLILLDIMMPGLDGYEVCRRLKADAATRDIPVIFLSALESTEDKVRAFQAGAVDFVTKPFYVEEVAARVSTHVHLARLRAELEARHETAAKSYARLLELERARDQLTHMIAHDMRSPLMTVMANVATLSEELAEDLTAEQRTDLAQIERTSRRLVALISDMLDASRLEEDALPFAPQRVPLAALLRDAVQSVAADQASRITIRTEDEVEAWGDPDLVVRVTENLVGNALRHAPTDTPITVSVDAEDDELRVEVTDRGPSIPKDERAEIFERFRTRPSQARIGSGVGLTFCRLAVERQGGRIGLACPSDGHGNRFWFTLPRPPRPRRAPPKPTADAPGSSDAVG